MDKDEISWLVNKYKTPGFDNPLNQAYDTKK